MRTLWYLIAFHVTAFCAPHALRTASGQGPRIAGSTQIPAGRAEPERRRSSAPVEANVSQAATGAPLDRRREVALLAPREALTSELNAKAEATATAEAAAANRVDATRLIYTASEEVASFALAGGADGMQLLLWGCIAALVSILAVSVVFISMHYHYQGSRRDVASANLSDLFPMRSHRRALSQQRSVKSSEGADSVSEGLSGSSVRSSESQHPMGGAAPPGLPLCPLLIVPDGTRLACIVQNDVRHKRQELSFDIVAMPTRSGTPLFRVRVSELGGETEAGIFVETLSGSEQLAFLSTEEVWKGVQNPVLTISRPWGLPYGTIQKVEDGTYQVLRGKTPLLVFRGNFQTHNIQVRSPRGTVAQTEGTMLDEYQVRMQALTDAGLVILGLLAIDKCEASADIDRKVSSGSSEPVA